MKFITKSGNEPPKIVDDNGNELGYQQGGDYVFNDKFGSRLGWINGLNYIYDTSGNRLGWIDGMNCIINTYNNKVGEIRSDGFYDNYGSRIDTIEEFFSLFGKPESDNIPNTTSSYSPASSNDNPGILGLLVAGIVFLIGCIWKLCAKGLGGKIGLGVGVISGIIAGIADKKIGTFVSFIIILPILLGIAGIVIEGIVRLIILIIRGIASLFSHKKDS